MNDHGRWVKVPAASALVVLGWMALAGAIHAASTQPPADAAAAIRALLTKTWDKPEAKVVADPIVVADDYAIAGWTQGDRGGRALLRKHGNAWAVVLCSGDPLRHASALIDAGVPAATAERLAHALGDAEHRTDPKRVGLFATFEGVMRMDEDNKHSSHR